MLILIELKPLLQKRKKSGLGNPGQMLAGGLFLGPSGPTSHLRFVDAYAKVDSEVFCTILEQYYTPLLMDVASTDRRSLHFFQDNAQPRAAPTPAEPRSHSMRLLTLVSGHPDMVRHEDRHWRAGDLEGDHVE